MPAEDNLLLACPGCLTANRVPRQRLGDQPKCGKCGAPLLEGKPVSLEASSFDAFVERSEPRCASPSSTMILFHGGREAARVAGAMDARAIRSWLNSL